ncbi:MAG TPA: DNA polymerase III subunit delta' [Phycisphaerae bacterium]|nr:DNA polymerase III subunit delta' [Phycisphaerae bacterium]
MQLSEVLHQDAVHTRIQRALAVDRVPHAFLFTGPEGVGREMMAMRLGAVLLCSQPVTGKPPHGFQMPIEAWHDSCGKCVDCELMAAGNHPDYHRIYRTLNKIHPDKEVQKKKAKDLSIEVIRHFVIDKVGLRPSRERAKVFVITDGDRLNPNSQNALLKTLEEPPAHSYIILLSTSAEFLLETTRSRCHHIHFNGLPADFIAEILMRTHGADVATARLLAELSQGSAGRAILYLQMRVAALVETVLDAIARTPDDPMGFAKTMTDLAKTLAAAIRAGGKELDDDEEDDTADLNTNRLAQNMLLGVCGLILRDVQRIAVGRRPAALLESSVVHRLGTRASLSGLRGAIRSLASAERQIEQNAQAQLVFDVVGLAIQQAISQVPAVV